MQTNDPPNDSKELMQRLVAPTPEGLAERILVAAQGLEQLSTGRVKARVQPASPQRTVRERLSSFSLGVRPALTMPLLMLVGVAVVAALGPWDRDANTHSNRFAEMERQELAIVLADLELHEIWLLQDELIAL